MVHQTNYNFTFPYLKTSDVKVSLDGVETTNFTFVNATTIQLNNGATPPVATAPANGALKSEYSEKLRC